MARGTAQGICGAPFGPGYATYKRWWNEEARDKLDRARLDQLVREQGPLVIQEDDQKAFIREQATRFIASRRGSLPCSAAIAKLIGEGMLTKTSVADWPGRSLIDLSAKMRAQEGIPRYGEVMDAWRKLGGQ